MSPVMPAPQRLMLYGRVVEKVNISVADLQSILRRFIGGGSCYADRSNA